MKGQAQENVSQTRGNLLLVVDYYHPVVGGAETLVTEFAQALARDGERVHVVTQRVPRNALATEVHNGVTVHRVWVPPYFARAWFMLVAAISVIQTARHAAMIHACGYASMLPARIAAWWLRLPAVVTIYEVLAEQLTSLTRLPSPLAWSYRGIERFLMRLRFDRYLCISRYTAERLARVAGIGSSSIEVIYPAVDYDFWKPGKHQARPLHGELGIPPSTRICLYFGRPGISKGIETIVTAANHLNDEPTRKCHLVMLLGRSPATGRQWVRNTIRRLGIESSVTVLDSVPRDQLPTYLLAADCVVIPSLSEGFGYSAVEAATIGCRLVVTKGHVFEEVLGNAACYVPRQDPPALAHAIRDTAWREDQDRSFLPARFDIASHVNAVRRVYSETLSR